MAKFDPTRPRGEVTFQCRECRNTFDAAPARVDDDPGQEHHPFRYFADCPKCKHEVPQAPWDRALQKAWLHATGPTSEAGKAAVTENIKGHPTPDETLRTRYNAMKTGTHARTATYFPAKPDGYSFCKGCEVKRDYCAAQAACVKQTEIFMLHHAAFDKKDPKVLQPIYADLQAAIFALLQRILQTIIADGVTLRSAKFTTHNGISIQCMYDDYEDLDAAGVPKPKVVWELEKHPLFQPLGELLSRNNLSLADMGMTTKVIEAQQDDELGRLTDKGSEPEAIEDFRRRQEEGLRQLGDLIASAQRRRERDPILIEHEQGAGDPTPVAPR